MIELPSPRGRERRPRAPQPTRATRRRSTLAVAAAALGAQLILAAALAVGLDGPTPWGSAAVGRAPQKARPIAVGDCVRTAPGREVLYISAACGDTRATGRVLAIIAGDHPRTEACPDESDFFATRPEQVICLRRPGTEHVGDPGEGGGVYRAGDCVARDTVTGLREVACGAPTVFETVVDRVRDVAECAPPALRFARLPDGERRVLCLGDGPGLATTGECIGDPEREPVTFDALPCQDGAARARINARVAHPSACGAKPHVRDHSGLPSGAVVCLERLR